MAKKNLRGIVDRIVDLPTLPQVVSTIMGLLDDPNSSARDINDVMVNDPALAGKILKLVNSAFYGLPNPVSSIQQAITILGFNTIKSLAISASVFDLFGDGDEHFSYEGFWTHSVGVAVISRHLGKRRPGLNGDTAFVVGLLHGVGKLVLDQYAPVEFQEIISRAREQELSFIEAEKQVIDTSHAEIGFWLTSRWKLAEEVRLAIQFQGRIDQCPERGRSLAAASEFANYVCRVKNYGASGDFNRPTLPRLAWEELGLDRDEFPVMMERINRELEDADSFLAVIHG